MYEKIDECKKHLGSELINIEPFNENGEEIISTKRIQNLALYVKKFIEIKVRIIYICKNKRSIMFYRYIKY